MRRGLLYISLLTAFSGIVLSLLINFLSDEPEVKGWLASLMGARGLAAAVAATAFVVLVAVCVEYYLKQKSERAAEAGDADDEFEEHIRRFFEILEGRYRERSRQKLHGRFEVALEANKNFDAAGPLDIKEYFDTHPSDGEASAVIGEAFESEGRLLIVGSPGIGKTVLLLNLAVRLFEAINEKLVGQQGGAGRRPLRITEPFPIIFNLASWSAEYRDFSEWLIAMLVEGEGLSRGAADRLLGQGRIIFLLDGLDELGADEEGGAAERQRARCLSSLNQYLERGQPAVISCRVEEYLQMIKATGQRAPVFESVIVRDLTRGKLEDALLGASDREVGGRKVDKAAAQNLMGLLGDKTFLEVLGTPFYFTTALEVFDQHILEGERFPGDEEGLRTHLINKYVEKKLSKTRNPNGFRPEESRRWLGWLARLLETKRLITFELVRLQPADITGRWSAGLFVGLMVGTAAGLLVGSFFFLFALFERSLGAGVYVGLRNGLVCGMTLGLIFALLGALVSGMEASAGEEFPTRASKFSWRYARHLLVSSVLSRPSLGYRRYKIDTAEIVHFSPSRVLSWAYWKQYFFKGLGSYASNGMVLGAVIGLYVAVRDRSLLSFSVGGVLGLIFGLGWGVLNGLFKVIKNLKSTRAFVHLKDPYQRMNSGWVTNFLLLISILAVQSGFMLAHGNSSSKTVRGLWIILSFIFHLSFLPEVNIALIQHFMLRLTLYLEGAVPLRYATFLNYAAEAGILERDGGHWRFRHQHLQKYFARQP